MILSRLPFFLHVLRGVQRPHCRTHTYALRNATAAFYFTFSCLTEDYQYVVALRIV